MRRIFVILEFFTIAISGDTTCSPPFSKSGVFCFYFDESKGNFYEKRTSCATIGGDLAKLDSAQKTAAMHDFMKGELSSFKSIVVFSFELAFDNTPIIFF